MDLIAQQKTVLFMGSRQQWAEFIGASKQCPMYKERMVKANTNEITMDNGSRMLFLEAHADLNTAENRVRGTNIDEVIIKHPAAMRLLYIQNGTFNSLISSKLSQKI